MWKIFTSGFSSFYIFLHVQFSDITWFHMFYICIWHVPNSHANSGMWNFHEDKISTFSNSEQDTGSKKSGKCWGRFANYFWRLNTWKNFSTEMKFTSFNRMIISHRKPKLKFSVKLAFSGHCYKNIFRVNWEAVLG